MERLCADFDLRHSRSSSWNFVNSNEPPCRYRESNRELPPRRSDAGRSLLLRVRCRIRKSCVERNKIYLHRLGARTFAPNLGQLPGRPPHWDLDEIPVIAAGFSILSRNVEFWERSPPQPLPADAGDAEPADRRYLRLPAVGAGVYTLFVSIIYAP
jgi:hypothetical protein